MLVTDREVYPRLNISDITLGKNSIVVKAFLTGKNKHLSVLSSKSEKLVAYSKIYFFLSAPSSPTSTMQLPANILVNPKKRIQNIAGYFGKSGLNIIKWPKILGMHFPGTSIDLAQVLSSRKDITSTELSNVSGISDINFEVAIPIDKELYDRVDVEEVRLHAFTHLDANAMVEAGEIPSMGSILKKYYAMGGNLKSKRILETTPHGLAAPKVKTVLATEDGKAYNGPFRGTGNQITAASTSIKLQKVEVPETDISAEFLIEKAAMPPAVPPLREEEDKLGYSFSKPFIDTTSLEVEDEAVDIYEPGYAKGTKQQSIKRKLNNTSTSFITNAYHYVSTEQASNVIYFDLQLEKIIKHKTEYGYLLDVANERKQLATLLTVGSLANSSISPETITSRVNIKEIVIKRTRVTEALDVYTSVGTVTKQKDKRQEETIARIENYNMSQGYSDDNVDLYVNTAKSSYGKKCMSLMDKELYINPRKGKYIYTIEIMLEDKVNEYFQTLVNGLRGFMKQCDIFLEEVDLKKAVIPVKDKIKVNELEISNYQTSLQPAINQYLLMLCWLGKKLTSEEILSLRTDIMVSTLPEMGGTLSGIRKFRNMCDIIITNFIKVMKASNIVLYSGILESKSKPGFSAAKEIPFQKITLDIPGTTESIEEGSIILVHSKQIDNNSVVLGDLSVNQGKMSMKAETYLYKEGIDTRPLIDDRTVALSKDRISTERKAMLVDNGIKTNMFGSQVERKIQKPRPSPEIATVFGLSGVTIGIPSNEGTFATNIGKAKPTESAAAEMQSGLNSVLDKAVSTSTRALSGKNKLTQQDKMDEQKIKIAKKRTSILDKTIKVLSSVVDKPPVTKAGSKKIVTPQQDAKIEDKLFKDRAGIVSVGMSDDSGEMIFSPLTGDLLQRITANRVIIKIEKSENKTEKEKYIVTDNVFEIPKKTLQDFIKQRT